MLLSIVGLGVEYPATTFNQTLLEGFIEKHYTRSPAIEKLLAVNVKTGIRSRSVFDLSSLDLVNGPSAPAVHELEDFFREQSLILAVKAAETAITDWGGDRSLITHTVATSSSSSGCPGYDKAVCSALNLSPSLQSALIAGAGCAGGLTAIRIATDIALGASHRCRPARILVFSCEVLRTLLRAELDEIQRTQKVQIGSALFADGAGACIISNGILRSDREAAKFDVLGGDMQCIPCTAQEMCITQSALGWRLHLSKDIPRITASEVGQALQRVTQQVSPQGQHPISAREIDWAVHPGGLAILQSIQGAMNLTPHHLRHAYAVYEERGNSSSVTIFNVLKRQMEDASSRETVFACAFGPGLVIESLLLRRRRKNAESS